MKRLKNIVLSGAATAMLAIPASATPIFGGTELLDAADASRMEQWLGRGSIGLSNIYAKEEGDLARDFHAAVDGQGETFTIIEVTGNAYGAFDQSILIGGYNPYSWGRNGYNYTTYGQRHAFIFNLNTQRMARQIQNNYRGQYQTFNHINYGPTFGGGHDIFVGTTLDHGYTYSYSYATHNGGHNTSSWHTSILGTYSVNLVIGAIEVFTIADATTTAVPEPPMGLLLTVGVTGLVITRRRKKRA